MALASGTVGLRVPGCGAGLRVPGVSVRRLAVHDRVMDGMNGRKQLVRPRSGRIVAGVCAGIGDYVGIDANLVRVLFALFTIFSAGAGALVYAVAWAVMPEEGEKQSIAENYLGKRRGG